MPSDGPLDAAPPDGPPGLPPDQPSSAGWRRLHPYSLIFTFASRLYTSRGLLVPLLLALVVTGRARGGWQEWETWLLVPLAGVLALEVVQYFTLGYRLDAHEIVISRGLLWRRVRHIPYARVQNVELVQNAAHRLTGVATVRLDTGTGGGAEGELAVLSLDAVEQLRDAVRSGRRGEPAVAIGSAPPGPGEDVLVALNLRELALYGLLTARGTVVIGAIAGLMWQADLDGWDVGRYLPSTKGLWGGLVTATPALILEIAFLLFVVVLLFRLLSAAWSVVKHFDFRLVARGPELFQSYGLLTRVGRTIPRARIQKLTVADDPWMRLVRRATLSVETAAAVAAKPEQQAVAGSHLLVPIVPAARVAGLVRDVHPAGAIEAIDDLSALDWRGVDPRTVRRLVPVRVAGSVLAGLTLGIWGLWWWALAAAVTLAAIFVVDAVLAARFTAFAWSGATLLFRSGAWRRRVSLVRAARVQVVSLHRSPFDRRWGMARVKVDTAGAAGFGHHVDIPWLPDDVATALYARLRRT